MILTTMGRGMKILTGQSALITGAGRGIGKAIALVLGNAGARVTVVARTFDEISTVADQIRDSGGDALAVRADVADGRSVRRAVEDSASRFGALSMLINNAGIPGPYGPIDAVDPAEWWAAQAVNVLGPFLFMNAVLPAMRSRGAGRIVNIVSNAGLQPIPHLSAYAVSKNTLTRLTETADLELRSASIRAFALNPGNITTDMARGTIASPDAQRWVPEGLAMIRDRKPEDSAADLARCCDVVLGLASGNYDALGGRYLDVHDDLDALLEAARSP